MCIRDRAGASASDSKAAGGAYEFETAPDPIPEGDIKETVDADVVVIGAGFSGLCCALAAAESGANVVMLERMDHVIGRGGSIYAMNSKLTKEKGYECSVEEVAQRYKRMMGYHSYRCLLYTSTHRPRSSSQSRWGRSRCAGRSRDASSAGGRSTPHRRAARCQA